MTITETDYEIKSVQGFSDYVEDFTASSENWCEPAATALGLATFQGDQIVDVHFFSVNGPGENIGTAVVMADVLALTGNCWIEVNLEDALTMRNQRFGPFLNDGQEHPNIQAIDEQLYFKTGTEHQPLYGRRQMPIAVFIEDIDHPPMSVPDVYLRFHLLSTCKVKPHGLNLNGAFGLLPQVVRTNVGPFLNEGFDAKRVELMRQGVWVTVFNNDRFPYLLDYVIPEGVRIAASDRVRLGAHLLPGATVMQEGFVNFNSGTVVEGDDDVKKFMIEGRISSEVTVGKNAHIGGSFSFQGMLAGGVEEPISVGDNFLGGANGGLGVPLGNDCKIAAGCYIMPESRCLLATGDGTVVKAEELKGQDGLTFVPYNGRRNHAEFRVLPTKDTDNMNSELFGNTTP